MAGHPEFTWWLISLLQPPERLATPSAPTSLSSCICRLHSTLAKTAGASIQCPCHFWAPAESDVARRNMAQQLTTKILLSSRSHDTRCHAVDRSTVNTKNVDTSQCRWSSLPHSDVLTMRD